MINIAIADDHALIREGLHKILSYEKDINILIEESSGETLLEKLKEQEVNIVLLDINMCRIDGIETLRVIKEIWPEIKVIMLTVEKQKRKINEAFQMGASGYLLKESAGSEINSAIRTVFNNKKYIDKSLMDMVINNFNKDSNKNIFENLTHRELRILLEISKGRKNKDIGEKLYLSEKTIKNYVTTIFRKIEVEDRVHATIFALNNNLEEYYEKQAGNNY